MSIYARSGHLGLAGGGEGGAAWTAWGGAASSRFAGEAEGLALDGEVTTFTLGADAVRSRSLAGVAVALSESEGSFRDREAAADPEGNSAGTLESTLTSVHPYARLQVSERLSVWGILGYGTGELTLEVDGTGAGRPMSRWRWRRWARGAYWPLPRTRAAWSLRRAPTRY